MGADPEHPQLYVPLQTLKVVEKDGKKYIYSNVQVLVKSGQTVAFSKNKDNHDPYYGLTIVVNDEPDSLWTYVWTGEVHILFDPVTDPLTWYFVTAKVYLDNENNTPPVGGVTNTIAGDGTIEME